MQIRDIMTTNVLTIPADSMVREVLEMFDNNRIHHIPVTGNDGEIVGMLSEKDIQGYMKLRKTFNVARHLKVSEIMTAPIFSYYDTVDIKKAAQAMNDNHLHAILVVNQSEKMVGILTSTDILRYVAGD